jgi:hypothetical protein
MQYISGPPMNPLTRLMAAIIGVLALVGAFFFGVFIFVGALVLGLLAWVAIRLRIWWLRRRLGNVGTVSPGGFGAQRPGEAPSSKNGEDVIEAEYEVISRKEE